MAVAKRHRLKTATMVELKLGELFGSVLVFGGAYSNLAATRALENVAKTRNIAPGNVICTGDVVAYCAEPEATVSLLCGWQIPVVMGNCEESLAAQAEDCGCGFIEGSLCSVLSRGWYAYASRQISESCRQWMTALPRRILFTLANRSFAVVHGSVRQMNRYIFASTSADEKIDEINAIGTDVVLAGHSGLPFGQCFGNKTWINAG
ncbi:MAG TPA: metallophosphoesterase, partial [Gammaproteobacteria bacterium]|nr:metallophosphoesterase [Gammaproteobacteria bacterium]